MKLPWNKKYLEISLHVIVTISAIYALKYGIDFIAYALGNLSDVGNTLSSGISIFLSNIIVVVIAFIFAYLLDPVVDVLQSKYDIISANYIKNKKANNKNTKNNKNKNNKNSDVSEPEYKERLEGTILTYISAVLIIVIVNTVLVNSINQTGSGSFIDNLTLSINNSILALQDDLNLFYGNIEDFLKSSNIYDSYIAPKINDGIKLFSSFIYDLGNNAISIITAFANGALNVFLSLVICFYFLKDKSAIMTKTKSIGELFLPKKLNDFINNSLEDIHAVFSGYIRGTLLDASIMSVLMGVTLYIIGVKFAIPIGLVAGFSNVIPYFGGLVAFALSISVCLISGEPTLAVYSTIAMAVLQQVDGLLIAPKIVGESVELSPVLVIIALSVAGNLFGIWGMVFAVPVFATLKIFAIRIYDRQKRKKELISAMKNIQE